MIYKYLITQEVEKWLKEQNYGPDVRNTIEQFRTCTTELVSEVSLIGESILCKPSGGIRLVWFKDCRHKYCLYILRRVYRHNVYEQEINNHTKDQWYENHQLSENEKEEVERAFEAMQPKEEREILPAEYRKYEGTRAFDKYNDVVFYEMPTWGEGMKKLNKDEWPFVQQTLFALIDGSDITNAFSQTGNYYHIATNGLKLTYRYGEPKGDGKSDIFLLQVVKGKEADLADLNERNYDREKADDLKNYSSKCYPDYYVYEYETWKYVEEDDKANLALSTEEVEILQSVKFPFFVSGLAGSGKSTILYYLYANIYKYKCENHKDHKLLFVSYNDALVDTARRSVKAILCNHSTNDGFKPYFEDEKNEAHFNNTFVPFRSFLKNYFLDEKDLEKFVEGKRINYERFRDLFQGCRNNTNGLSASILWSVIRTFIKGRSMDYFTPEDYATDQVTRADRTISEEKYQDAYRLWEKWYKPMCEREGYWDDLDLVRHCLTKANAKVWHAYAVVFCDEAQDFTKLEIDLILKLSCHSKYNLSTQPEDRAVPIAFAGDPNQTISPTGFRWASTKDLFNQAFNESLGNRYVDLDIKELTTNYRSQLGIVKIANFIQSIRYKYFDDKNGTKTFQRVREDLKDKTQDALEYVGFYPLNEQTEQTILECLPKANIITSGDGEIDERTDYPEIKNEQVKLNTPIGTKGLEYAAVMLYKFCKDSTYKIFEKIVNDQPLNDAERFEVAHFFTKLYIAVSRAKNQLFIVDTEESYEHFWKYFADHALWEKLVNIYVQEEGKRRLVGHATMGDVNTLLTRLDEAYDPEENGRQEFELAVNTRSEKHMKMAQSYFSEAGKTKLVDLCAAYLLLFAEQYEQAGDAFLQLDRTEHAATAAEAYWKGLCWKKVETTLLGSQDANDKVKVAVARYMTGAESVKGWIEKMAAKCDDLHNCLYAKADDKQIWNKVLAAVKKQLSGLKSVEITPDLLDNIDTLSPYFEWYEQGLAATRAEMYFKHALLKSGSKKKTDPAFPSHIYERAAAIWEEIKDTLNNKNYFTAKKVLATTESEEIKWMNLLSEHKEIIRRFGSDSMASELTQEAQETIWQILLRSDYGRAISYPIQIEQSAKWNRLYDADRVQFLLNVVLEAFSLDKFQFLESRVQNEEVSVFEEKRLPAQLFEKIFALNEQDATRRPYWVYFMVLKNLNGKRVLSHWENRGDVIKALCGAVKEDLRIAAERKRDVRKGMASALLEMVFDKEYNFERTEMYKETLAKLFNANVFGKADFRLYRDGNRYFREYVNLDGDALDTIKDNIRSFVCESMRRSKKVSSKDEETIWGLCRAYETSVPYSKTQEGSERLWPDYLSISRQYGEWKKVRNLEKVVDWMDKRMVFNQWLADYTKAQKTCYADLAEELTKKHHSEKAFVQSLSREDAQMFVIACNTGEKYHYNGTVWSALLLYKHEIRKDHLRAYTKVEELRATLGDSLDVAVEELLCKSGRINEYELKLLTYAWEVIFDARFAAKRYNDVIKNERLAKLTILQKYLKERALRLYSIYDKAMFDAKKKEYSLSINPDGVINPPIIEEPKEEPKGISDREFGKMTGGKTENTEGQEKATSAQTTPKRREQKKPQATESSTPAPTELNVSEDVKQIVLNFKAMGMADEMIAKGVNLPVEVIAKL